MSKNKKKNILIGIVVLFLFSTFIYNNTMKPHKLDKYITNGNKYLLELNYKKSLSEFDKALKINDESLEAIYGKVKAYIGTNNINNAIKQLRKAEYLDSQNSKVIKKALSILNDLEKMNSLISDTKTGKEVGNIDQYYKDRLQLAIDQVKVLLNGDLSNYEEIQNKIEESINEFKSSIIRPTDNMNLLEAINTAENLYNNSTEGINEGQYINGSRQLLRNSINDARKVNSNKLSSQQNIDDATYNLNNGIINFEKSKIEKNEFM